MVDAGLQIPVQTIYLRDSVHPLHALHSEEEVKFITTQQSVMM